MILNMSINTFEWQYREKDGFDLDSYNYLQSLFCFDCQIFSDYVSESEIFSIGGARRFVFESIIDVQLGINFETFITGLKQLIHGMSDGNGIVSDNMAKTTFEKQMVLRLLLHQIYKHDPNHAAARPFSGCPNIIEPLLYEICAHVTRIRFHADMSKDCGVHNKVLKHDNGWIKLHLIVTIFPNVTEIYYDATNEKVPFLKTIRFYDSVLEALKNKKCNLEMLRLHVQNFYLYLHPDGLNKSFYKCELSKYGYQMGYYPTISSSKLEGLIVFESKQKLESVLHESCLSIIYMFIICMVILFIKE
eukprot:274742_1